MEQTKVQCQCGSCKELFNGDERRILLGDSFYTFTCRACGGGEERFERMALTWLQLVHLVLFHLSAVDKLNVPQQEQRWFAWKDDICAFIDANWDWLCVGRTRSPTWPNTIAKELSTHPLIFLSGKNYGVKSGWALADPSQPPDASIKAQKQLSVPKKKQSLRADSASKNIDGDSPSTDDVKSDFALIPNIEEDHINGPSLQIKSQRRQRKIKDERKIKEEPQSTDPDAIQPPNYISTDAAISNNILSQTTPISTITLPKVVTIMPKGSKSPAKRSYSDNVESTLSAAPESNTFKEPRLRHLTPSESYILIQKCTSSLQISHNPTISRLRRRLLLLQAHKLRQIRRLDLDAIASRSIKDYRPDPEPMERFLDQKLLTRYDLDSDMKPVVVFGKQDMAFERCIAARIENIKKYKITNIPAPFSFQSKILGNPHFAHTLTSQGPWISVYTGNALKPFIWRDSGSIWRAPRFRLLNFIRGLKFNDDINDAADSIPPALSVDYVYFQRIHLEQVNEMLSTQFWPGIDVTEHLNRPDFSVVALYKRIVIGCAFIMPDGYISYIMVRPGWQRAGIARFMLYHLLQTVAPYGKDCTLHVSANNKAMMLYQSFGFKAEEFIIHKSVGMLFFCEDDVDCC
ncbi:Cysteine-rich protein 2-binding protein [Physocladia obscura]|uniref:Cysteine-rich protein 2-binding protein n=1 Tax=Physocladia obscura TaxID=109957 RepID=A0AAD5X9Z7_9FUNG|nr:Cysteine-rich protein 2-binding protein [Physocladia obscura]